MKNNRTDNLIFLISQPRAGSTMMQRILGGHPDIYTTSEPWLMLHPFYALKDKGIETEYSSTIAAKGVSDFISYLPGGQVEYYDRLREMYSTMYQRVIEKSGKLYFLDKTPRYYFIIRELHELFPKAKIIILFRNPLAVLASIISTWTKRDWYQLSKFKYDLIDAPNSLLEAVELLKTSCKSLLYENFLADPENLLKDICNYLNVDYIPEIVSYGESQHEKWSMGDQGVIYEKKQPDTSHTDKWKDILNNPQAWRVINEYCEFIGKDRFEKMGYEYDILKKIIDENKPSVEIDKHSIGLWELLDNTRSALIDNKRLTQQLHQKNQLLNQKNEQLNQKNEQLNQKNEQLKNKDIIIQQDNILINQIYNSVSYKLGNFLIRPVFWGRKK